MNKLFSVGVLGFTALALASPPVARAQNDEKACYAITIPYRSKIAALDILIEDQANEAKMRLTAYRDAAPAGAAALWTEIQKGAKDLNSVYAGFASYLTTYKSAFPSNPALSTVADAIYPEQLAGALDVGHDTVAWTLKNGRFPSVEELANSLNTPTAPSSNGPPPQGTRVVTHEGSATLISYDSFDDPALLAQGKEGRVYVTTSMDLATGKATVTQSSENPDPRYRDYQDLDAKTLMAPLMAAAPPAPATPQAQEGASAPSAPASAPQNLAPPRLTSFGQKRARAKAELETNLTICQGVSGQQASHIDAAKVN